MLLLSENVLVHNVGACLWTTLRVFVDGKTCLTTDCEDNVEVFDKVFQE